MPGLGNRGKRLAHFARQLKPPPKREPFYVWSPYAMGVDSPGWYMVRSGRTLYLGYSAVDAEACLRELLGRKASA